MLNRIKSAHSSTNSPFFPGVVCTMSSPPGLCLIPSLWWQLTACFIPADTSPIAMNVWRRTKRGQVLQASTLMVCFYVLVYDRSHGHKDNTEKVIKYNKHYILLCCTMEIYSRAEVPSVTHGCFSFSHNDRAAWWGRHSHMNTIIPTGLFVLSNARTWSCIFYQQQLFLQWEQLHAVQSGN